MTRLILDRIVLPRREFSLGAIDRGDPWADEVDEAQWIAGRWGAQWFTPAGADRWLRAHGNKVQPELARRLANASITPTEAALRLWYGKINELRPSIADRVSWGDLTPQAARVELDSFRQMAS